MKKVNSEPEVYNWWKDKSNFPCMLIAETTSGHALVWVHYQIDGIAYDVRDNGYRLIDYIPTGDEQQSKKFLIISNDYNMDKQATYNDISEVIKERVDRFNSEDNILEERLSIEAINKMLHDLTEFGMTASYVASINNGKGFCIQSINQMDMRAITPAAICGHNHNVIVRDDIELAKMREPSFPANINQYYTRSYASKDTMELVDAILFQEEKQPKDNHPNGWYRKFDKKRY